MSISSKMLLPLTNIVKLLHLKVIGSEMGTKTIDFLKNLSWSIVGGIIANGIMFLLTMYAGKALGPEEFGKYNYILSIATSLSFLFILGNSTSSIRYIADKEHENDKKEIFSTSLILVLFQSIVFGIIFYIVLATTKQNHQAITNKTAIICLIFSLVYSLKSIFDSYLRAFRLIKQQSLIRVIDTLVSLSSFLILLLVFKRINYYSYFISVITGMSVFIISCVILLHNNFTSFSLKIAKLLFNYNKYLVVASLGSVILGLEKYFIGSQIGNKELGIYSIYYSSSFLIISNLGSIFMNVFQPDSVREKSNMFNIIHKLQKIITKGFPVWLLVNTLFSLLVITYMGNNYSTNYLYIILFSISSYLAFIFSLFISLLQINFVKKSVVITILSSVALISTIIISKNITIYLIGQILVYFAGYISIKKMLTSNLQA